MRKLLNEHLDKIEKQTVEEMQSAEKSLQGQYFIFSKLPSMALRYLSICAMAVDDLAFSVTL
jgi:hypothetical protein